MSYCRWSDDDYQCDLYVYESVGGFWSINVAGNRVVYKSALPATVPFSSDTLKEWHERYETVHRMIDAADRVDIDLPHAGESFSDATAGECADRLEYLRGLGYAVPQHAIDALREEQQEVPNGG